MAEAKMESRQTTETINGTEYTFQKMSAREWARLRDRCKNRAGIMLEENFMSEVFKHLVVAPKVTLDDFDDWAEAQEVANSAISFQHGRAVID